MRPMNTRGLTVAWFLCHEKLEGYGIGEVQDWMNENPGFMIEHIQFCPTGDSKVVVTLWYREAEPVGAPGLGGDPHSGVASDDESILSIKEMVRRVEPALICRALAKTGGNRSAAAKLLEISRETLLARIQQYGIKM